MRYKMTWIRNIRISKYWLRLYFNRKRWARHNARRNDIYHRSVFFLSNFITTCTIYRLLSICQPTQANFTLINDHELTMSTVDNSRSTSPIQMLMIKSYFFNIPKPSVVRANSNGLFSATACEANRGLCDHFAVIDAKIYIFI